MTLERDQRGRDLGLVIEELGKVLQVEEGASKADADAWVMGVREPC